MTKSRLTAGVVALAVFASAAGAQTNLILNPSFEASASGWAGTRARVARVTSVGGAPGFGAAALKASWSASGSFWDIYVTPRPKQNTVAGQDFQARVFIRHPNAGRVICLRLREWSANSGGSIIREVQKCVTSIANTWQEAVVTLSDVAASHAVGFSVERTDACDASCYFLIDGARLYEVTLPPQCNDGLDNDGDGYLDYPNDPGCTSASDTTEAPNPACSNGVDDDGDGRIDAADPMCSGLTDNDEGGDPACNDVRDNDSDGKIDFPADPGCSSLADTDETDPAPVCTKTLTTGSVTAFVNTLAPGEVGCLRGSFAENVTIRNPGITLTSAPGQTAVLQGRLWVTSTATDVTVSNLFLDGRNVGGGTLPSPTVHGDRVTFRGNEITNFHTGICLSVGNTPAEGPWGVPSDVVIERNRIHDCGRLPPPINNHHHGIYVDSARNTIIRNNYIYDNSDRCVQLYPDAQGTLVENNVMDGCGEGGNFGGDVISSDNYASSNNTYRRNIISNATVRWLIESYWGGSVGTGNVVTENCLWPTNSTSYYNTNDGIDPTGSGFTVSSNIKANPLYVDRAAKNFALQPGSPCAGYGPQ